MLNVNELFQTLYQNFNARNIDLVIAQMSEDVKWADGMEGGFVFGHEEVREYWTRQFKMVSSSVTPLEIKNQNDWVEIKVRQVVHDLQGNLLANEMVTHIFRMSKGKIAEFNIEKC
ncbi:MAG: nuclear transport factor 2 family protein [Bacteroidota bacterium]